MAFPIGHGLWSKILKNHDLAKDYLFRSTKRIKAVQVLFDEKSWADVVRESQEIVELCLKGLLRHYSIEFPRTHDVSAILEQNKNVFPRELQNQIKNLAKISRNLRRDREIAFYGLEDLVPSEFYSEEDAEDAMTDAKNVIKITSQYIK